MFLRVMLGEYTGFNGEIDKRRSSMLSESCDNYDILLGQLLYLNNSFNNPAFATKQMKPFDERNQRKRKSFIKASGGT